MGAMSSQEMGGVAIKNYVVFNKNLGNLWEVNHQKVRIWGIWTIRSQDSEWDLAISQMIFAKKLFNIRGSRDIHGHTYCRVSKK